MRCMGGKRYGNVTLLIQSQSPGDPALRGSARIPWVRRAPGWELAKHLSSFTRVFEVCLALRRGALSPERVLVGWRDGTGVCSASGHDTSVYWSLSLGEGAWVRWDEWSGLDGCCCYCLFLFDEDAVRHLFN